MGVTPFSMHEWQWYQIALVAGVCLMITLMVGRTLKLISEGKQARANALKSRMSSIRGQTQEKRAKKYLQSLGFSILEHQPTTEVGWWIDGVWTQTSITGDYLVKRDGEVGLVEVKTGRAASATHRDTRRQLLEYHHAFDVDAVFLYDVERSQLQRIEFESIVSRASSGKKTLLWLIIGCFLGFFVRYYLSH